MTVEIIRQRGKCWKRSGKDHKKGALEPGASEDVGGELTDIQISRGLNQHFHSKGFRTGECR